MMLVDSCTYIDWMREGVNPVKRLQTHRANLVTCDIVQLEVLRGVTDPKSNHIWPIFSQPFIRCHCRRPS